MKHTVTTLDRNLGGALQEFLYSPPIFQILGDGTWLAGGCWILADALHRWVGPSSSLKMVASDRSTSEHVVVRAGSWYLHASGVITEAELLDEMRRMERLVNPRIVDFNPRLLIRNGVPRPGRRSRLLLVEIRRRFGLRPVLLP
jgi:hypothetical protein